MESLVKIHSEQLQNTGELLNEMLKEIRILQLKVDTLDSMLADVNPPLHQQYRMEFETLIKEDKSLSQIVELIERLKNIREQG